MNKKLSTEIAHIIQWTVFSPWASPQTQKKHKEVCTVKNCPLTIYFTNNLPFQTNCENPIKEGKQP